MARDTVIKSGQLTIPRILFLAVVGGIIVATVALGGIWLTVGYWLLTIGICGLLFLIAIDYGVRIDKVNLQAQQPQPGAVVETAPAAEGASATISAPRAKRRASRPAKRRR